MKDIKENTDLVNENKECNDPITTEEIQAFEKFFKENPIMEVQSVPGADSDARHRINLSGTSIKVSGSNPGVLLNNECYVANARSTIIERDGYNVYYMVTSGVMGYGMIPYVKDGSRPWSDYGWGTAAGGIGRLFKVRRDTSVFNSSGYYSFTLPAGSIVSSWCQAGYNYPYLMRITSYQKPNDSIITTNSYIDTGLRTYSGKNNMNVYGNW